MTNQASSERIGLSRFTEDYLAYIQRASSGEGVRVIQTAFLDHLDTNTAIARVKRRTAKKVQSAEAQSDPTSSPKP